MAHAQLLRPLLASETTPTTRSTPPAAATGMSHHGRGGDGLPRLAQLRDPCAVADLVRAGALEMTPESPAGQDVLDAALEACAGSHDTNGPVRRPDS